MVIMALKPLPTLLTENDLHELTTAAHQRAKIVSIRRESLLRLIVDHGNLVEIAPDGILTPEGKHV